MVTAQKRTENLQDVPVSIQALSTAKLEQLHVSSFDDYAKFLPSVSFQCDATGGPGFEHIYMRGVVERRRRQPLRLAAERRHVSR